MSTNVYKDGKLIPIAGNYSQSSELLKDIKINGVSIEKSDNSVNIEIPYNVIPNEATESNQLADKKYVIDKLAEIVANAPESLDTLKEISDWIASHENSAAAMNSAIQSKVTGSGNISFDSNGNIDFNITDAFFEELIK